MFLSKLTFLFKNTQFIYSLLLIILIPLALVANTLWVIRLMDRDSNLQLRKEAALIGTVISSFSAASLEDPQFLIGKLTQIQKEETKLKSISLLVPDENNKFQVVASTNNTMASTTDPALSQFVFSSGQAHAAVVLDSVSSEQVWSVLTPLKSDERQVIGLVDVKISPREVNEILARSTKDSLVVLGATIFVVLLLLLNHLKFFEYALLFRKLKEIDQMKDDFISLASHELKTPLTAMKGFSSMLSQDLALDKKANAQKHASIIAQEASSLAELVDDLLNVSRIEQNRLSFDLKELNLNDTLTKVIIELISQAEKKGLQITTNLLPSPPLVEVDELRLKEVFTNLIGNSIKYTLKGEIKISQEVKDGMLRTFIEDTGVGMSPESRGQLFEKFYRVRTEMTKNITGTGLGLWITKQIVEKMKGRIFVDSIEGKGSRFTVDFPAEK